MQRKHICKNCHKYFDNAISPTGRSLHICPECKHKKRKIVKPEDVKLKIHETYIKNKEYHKKYYLKNKVKILKRTNEYNSINVKRRKAPKEKS